MTANVALTDTFDQWRVKTNEIVVMTQTDGMSNIIKTIVNFNNFFGFFVCSSWSSVARGV